MGTTERLQTLSYPNGQTTELSYLGATDDHRLQQILHKKPGGALLSRHAYTYEPSGNIKTWTQETDVSAAKVYDFEYDRSDQLTAATLKTTDPTPTVLKRYVYAYDAAGNRTSEQIDNGVTSALHNNMNQTTTTQPGGMLRLAGTTNEAANVTIAGQQAQILPGNRFQGETPVGSGTTSVPIVATDGSGNQRTYTYNVSVSGSTKTLTYDANGNLLSDGTRTYEWDALDQLTAINQGTHRSEFTYDGEGHGVRIVEKENGATVEDRRFIWDGPGIAEERDAAGGVVKRHLIGGVQESGTPYFQAGDHLGSLRELTDTAGVVRARYDFDPYGRRTKTSGDVDADRGFAGILDHANTGLGLAAYRGFDSSRGSWLSQDPIGLRGGLNLYAYVKGDPINKADPLGLEGHYYVIVYGDPGLGGPHDHNVGRNFQRAAMTLATQLTAQGNMTLCQHVSTAGQLNQLITGKNPQINGLFIFSHGGVDPRNGLPAVFLGQDPDPTNVPAASAHNLTSQTIVALSQRNLLAPGALIMLNACSVGGSFNGQPSIAQTVANWLQRTTWGSTGYLTFSPTNTWTPELSRPHFQPPPTGPLYMVPDPTGVMWQFNPRR